MKKPRKLVFSIDKQGIERGALRFIDLALESARSMLKDHYEIIVLSDVDENFGHGSRTVDTNEAEGLVEATRIGNVRFQGAPIGNGLVGRLLIPLMDEFKDDGQILYSDIDVEFVDPRFSTIDSYVDDSYVIAGCAEDYSRDYHHKRNRLEFLRKSHSCGKFNKDSVMRVMQGTYINSGLLIMNLARMRRENWANSISDKLTALVDISLEMGGVLPEQDFLNFVSDDIKVIPSSYNMSHAIGFRECKDVYMFHNLDRAKWNGNEAYPQKFYRDFRINGGWLQEASLPFGTKMESYNLHNTEIWRTLKDGRFYGEEVLDVVRGLGVIRQGDVVVDGGAFIGDTALYFSRGCGASKVHAFEPSRIHYAMMERNISLNGVESSIIPHECALGKDNTRCVMTSPDQFFGGGEIYEERQDGDFQVRRLDDFNIKADFLKIDCEGHQLDVILGGMKTISGARAVLVEMWGKELADRRKESYADHRREWVDEPRAILESMGFRCLVKLSEYDYLFVKR